MTKYLSFLTISVCMCIFNSQVYAFDIKENCTFSMTCTASSAPNECDECWGWGHLSWVTSTRDCSGTGNNTYNDCDDTSLTKDLTACDIAEDGGTFDDNIDMYTYGAVDCGGDCQKSDTKYNCHWDFVTYDEVEAEATGSYEADYVVIKKESSTPINSSMVGDEITWTKGGSSSLTLGTNASLSATLKGVFGAELGFSIEDTKETNWSSTYKHTYKSEEVDLYGAPFYNQERGKRPIRYREWTCDGPGTWTDTYGYRGFPASVVYNTAEDSAGLIALESHSGWLGSDSTDLTEE